MKRKFTFIVHLLVLSIILPAFGSSAYALVLNVPERFQEQNEWCWAGVSQPIFNYYGRSITQSTIANYGTLGVNTWNYLYGQAWPDTDGKYRRGINMILNNWGLTCTYDAYTMSQAQILNRINAYQPFVIRWGWTTGGGHFVVGRGYSGNYVYIMDPWPGNGYEIQTYAWVVNDGSHSWTHSLELTSSPPPTPPPTSSYRVLAGGDYNGDGNDDIAIFRPSSGLWSVREVTRVYFGSSGDIPVPGNYGVYGRTDIGIYRPSSGLWAIRGYNRVYYGSSSDIPIPGDYNGNGVCGPAVYRPSSGLWSIWHISRIYFGNSSDKPVPADYNGDGTSQICIFRESNGLWACRSSFRGYFGTSGDIPYALDPYDYAAGIGIYRPSAGMWAISGYSKFYFGGSSDQPVPANFLGSAGDDIAIFRPSSGLWAIRNGNRYYYGTSGDIPVTR
jgi:peptidase C39-like protein/FG-GAP repeat protein